MKLLVIGVGKGGARVADAFAQLNKKARGRFGASIITGAYAASNDRALLETLVSKEADWLFRLPIGGLPSGAAGVKELGVDMIQAETDRIMSRIRRSEHFDTAAFLVVCSASGSFGSNLGPVIAQKLRDRHTGKPVYSLALLPAESDESASPKRVYNTAVCLKSLSKVSDAVFLVDNEKLKREDLPGAADQNWSKLNPEIVEPFMDLLCSSELIGSKYAGSQTLSIGDVMQTLGGFTVIGQSTIPVSSKSTSGTQLTSALEKGTDTMKALEAMNLALGHFLVDCDPKEAGRALYLLSAPSRDSNINMLMALGNRLRELSENGEIRGGDFEGERDSIKVIIVLSKLAYVERVKNLYDRAVAALKTEKTEKAS
jgi:cell division GTPase FtsZ